MSGLGIGTSSGLSAESRDCRNSPHIPSGQEERKSRIRYIHPLARPCVWLVITVGTLTIGLW